MFHSENPWKQQPRFPEQIGARKPFRTGLLFALGFAAAKLTIAAIIVAAIVGIALVNNYISQPQKQPAKAAKK